MGTMCTKETEVKMVWLNCVKDNNEQKCGEHIYVRHERKKLTYCTDPT